MGTDVTVLDRYFELSDLAGKDQASFRLLLECFSENAVVKPAGGAAIRGRHEIEKFYGDFFQRSRDLRHLWNTREVDGALRADWAVVGRRPDGSLFSFLGEDVAEVDADHRITRLDIVIK